MLLIASAIALSVPSAAESQSSRFTAFIYWEGAGHYIVTEQVSTNGGLVNRSVCDGGSRCEVPYRHGVYQVRSAGSQRGTQIVVDPPPVATRTADVAGQSDAKVTYFVLAQVDETAVEVFW
jgi:hypothetical protein